MGKVAAMSFQWSMQCSDHLVECVSCNVMLEFKLPDQDGRCVSKSLIWSSSLIDAYLYRVALYKFKK